MDRRRLIRVPGQLSVEVRGVDQGPTPRAGDISTSGVFFETRADPGPIGSVHMLSLASPDGVCSVTVMAQLVRCAVRSDSWKGQTIIGVAYRFLPDRPELTDDVEALVNHLRTSVPPTPVSVADNAPAVHTTGVMVMDAPWALTLDESVEVTVNATQSARTVEMIASVVSVSPVATERGLMHRTTLRVQRVTGATGATATSVEGMSIAEALGALVDRFELLDEDVNAPPQERLAGMVSFVSLPGLLSFLELQRLSGVLTVVRASERAFIHVRGGRVVDVELGGLAVEPAVAAVIEVLRWQDGNFEFSRDDSPRPDRVGRPTMELLLEAARLSDEAGRDQEQNNEDI